MSRNDGGLSGHSSLSLMTWASLNGLGAKASAVLSAKTAHGHRLWDHHRALSALSPALPCLSQPEVPRGGVL